MKTTSAPEPPKVDKPNKSEELEDWSPQPSQVMRLKSTGQYVIAYGEGRYRTVFIPYTPREMMYRKPSNQRRSHVQTVVVSNLLPL